MCCSPRTQSVAKMSCKGPGNASKHPSGHRRRGPKSPKLRNACAALHCKICSIWPRARRDCVIFSRIAAISGFARPQRIGKLPRRARKRADGPAIGVGTHGAGGLGRWPIAPQSQKLIRAATQTLCESKKRGVEPRIQLRFPRRLTKVATVDFTVPFG